MGMGSNKATLLKITSEQDIRMGENQIGFGMYPKEGNNIRCLLIWFALLLS